MNLDSVPSITVTGIGEKSVVPDAVFITLGVQTRGKDAGEAMRENNSSMQRMFDDLERAGIGKDDVQTSSFNINPLYEISTPRRGSVGEQSRIVGYQVSNQVRIKSKEIDQLGSLLDSLVREGANTMHGIEFGVSEIQDAADKARKDAIADAKRKAELLAAAAGASVGRPLKISEAVHTRAPIVMWAQMAIADSSVPLAEGEQQISASVTVMYELKASEI